MKIKYKEPIDLKWVGQDPPYNAARAISRIYHRPIKFRDKSGFEMVAFPIDDPYTAVVSADAWDECGPDAYDPDQNHMESKPRLFGSVSHGTLRDEDLIPIFMYLLEEHDPEEAARITARYLETGWPHYRSKLAWGDPFDNKQKEMAPHLFGDLYEALSDLASPGYYFGAHPGDGADFGFWLISPEDCELSCFLQLPTSDWLGRADEMEIKAGADVLAEHIEDVITEWEDSAHESICRWVEQEYGISKPINRDDEEAMEIWEDAYEKILNKIRNLVATQLGFKE